jgi:uncharacterized BrkB/YihY/UPF0761 family membrane protein
MISVLKAPLQSAFAETRRVWAILWLAVKSFLRIDGAHWAGAFAFHAFFSLFPLMILLVTDCLLLC